MARVLVSMSQLITLPTLLYSNSRSKYSALCLWLSERLPQSGDINAGTLQQPLTSLERPSRVRVITCQVDTLQLWASVISSARHLHISKCLVQLGGKTTLTNRSFRTVASSCHPPSPLVRSVERNMIRNGHHTSQALERASDRLDSTQAC